MAQVPENDRLTGPFIATAGQTDFPADFPLLKPEALRVRRERAGVTVILRDPDVAPIGEGAEGFTARLAMPSEGGDRLWVYSELPAARLRAHTPNGSVRTPTLEGDAEEFQAQLQEVRRELGRAVLAAPGKTPPSPEDVIAAAEAVAGKADIDGGNVPRANASDFRTALHIYDVRPEDFGPSGGDVADSSATIQAAIDYARASNRRRVFLRDPTASRAWF